MTAITDHKAAALPVAQRLHERWSNTQPARPAITPVVIVNWQAPSLLQRLRNAWRAAAAEMKR